MSRNGTAENRIDGLWKGSKGRLAAEVCFFVILLFFPLRHITWGLDLWDTGYNYANYTYCGPEHMGITWWFSTYLANLIGHVLTLLPYGDTLLGMNLYTGLLVSLLGLGGYFFCTRRLLMKPAAVFAGEMIALCLCWCPTAKLYDYLTYLFFLGCVMLLYEGLRGEKRVFLVFAGICLGANVFVRFSNLPEAGLILAVWAYAVICGLERKAKAGEIAKMAVQNTLWCLIGYLIALGIGFGWIAVRYGISEYVEGIRLLFAMTETATDYKATSMLYGLIWPFWNGKYWVARILVFAVAAFLFGFAADYAPLCLKAKAEGSRNFFTAAGYLTSIGFTVILVIWLFTKKEPSFTSVFYKSYDPIYWPAVIFLILGIGICTIQIFRKGCRKEEKLLAGMLLLAVFLTSLGSNNGIYPSFNNLFILAPYVIGRALDFTKWTYVRSRKKPADWTEFRLNFLPAAIMLWGLMGLLTVQFALFGIQFAFCEGTGIQMHAHKVQSSSVLKGVGMSWDRAVWMEELCTYAKQEGLEGREVILYGNIPALSFYLRMPAAFNTWSDLESYNIATMETAVKDLMGEISGKGREKPVVIAEAGFVGKYQEKYGENSKEENAAAEKTSAERKWDLILEFMEDYSYEMTFENDKFIVWQAK